MKTNENDMSIENIIADIQRIFPGQLTLSVKQLAKIRDKSVQTLSRERKKGLGIPYKGKEENGNIEYPVREVAIWLQSTIKTA